MIIVDSKAFNQAKEKNPLANHFLYFRPDYIVACYEYDNAEDFLIFKMEKYYHDRHGLIGVLMDRNGKVTYRNDNKQRNN